MAETDAGEVARAEAARQLVVLAFGVATLVIYVWGQRWAADPDVARTGRMTVAKKLERGWARLGHACAGFAYRQAEKARLAYERDRA